MSSAPRSLQVLNQADIIGSNVFYSFYSLVAPAETFRMHDATVWIWQDDTASRPWFRIPLTALLLTKWWALFSTYSLTSV